MFHLQTNQETHGEVEEHPEIQRLISSFHHQYRYRELGITPLLKLLGILMATPEGHLWLLD